MLVLTINPELSMAGLALVPYHMVTAVSSPTHTLSPLRMGTSSVSCLCGYCVDATF